MDLGEESWRRAGLVVQCSLKRTSINTLGQLPKEQKIKLMLAASAEYTEIVAQGNSQIRGFTTSKTQY